MKGVMTLLGH